ncbi:uncharacterized protein LOC103375226 [Stegastes partitus]|uniref:Uncharacterized protein LOC103375226 n=1 Tax=Stegastes partitus TaxID=144197 RepID=A0A9Y4NV42_9TELE|nr:PREDICTED: uncharacterized protein LOC103375226 [Stegastes partitus]
MWLFLMVVALLDHSWAAPLPGKHGGLQLLLQDQVYVTFSTTPAAPPQKQSSSSSSSSSSASSESSQSSEGPQQLRERQNLENTAVEQVDSSQESSERLQTPSNTSSLWLNELVRLGQRVFEREGDAGDEDAGDDSVESRHRALMLTYHHLLSRLRHRETGAVRAVGGAAGDVGGAREEKLDGQFPRLLVNNIEEGDGLTFDLPGLGSHGDEAELELGL